MRRLKDGASLDETVPAATISGIPQIRLPRMRSDWSWQGFRAASRLADRY